MNTTPEDQAAALKFADAICSIWGENLDLAGIVMQGYRELLAARGATADPETCSAKLDLALEQARYGVDTPDTVEAKLNMVRGLLHVWFRVQPHLVNQIFAAVRYEATARGEDPTAAINSAHQLIDGARSLDAYFAEKRGEMLTERSKRDAARGRELQALRVIHCRIAQ